MKEVSETDMDVKKDSKLKKSRVPTIVNESTDSNSDFEVTQSQRPIVNSSGKKTVRWNREKVPKKKQQPVGKCSR